MSDLSSVSDSDVDSFDSSDEVSPHHYSESEVEMEDIQAVSVRSDVDGPHTSDSHSEGRSNTATRSTRTIHGVDRDKIQPYAEEPEPTTAWLEDYNQRRERWLEDQEELKNRLENHTSLHEWCKCGKCNTDNLENPRECKCCTEIPKCEAALNDEWVKQEVERKPSCITEHPGFQVVCLNRWSLKLSADKYKTLKNKKYKNTGDEKRFLRAVAYREFTRLVHGRLGYKRIPLPSCAYHVIRSAFNVEENIGFKEVQQ